MQKQQIVTNVFTMLPLGGVTKELYRDVCREDENKGDETSMMAGVLYSYVQCY